MFCVRVAAPNRKRRSADGLLCLGMKPSFLRALMMPVLTVGLLCAAGCHTGTGSEFHASAERVEHDRAVVLSAIAKLGPGAGKEISGIVRSHRDPGVYWTLNDSGDEPRVYPVRLDGSVVPSVRAPETPGTIIAGAINGDWEDIALDASGRLIVADVGNNTNARADLCLYIVPEPETTEGRTAALRQIFVRYPDQTSLPAPKDNFNFDCEGVFTVGDEIFMLSKHRSDTMTKLYRVKSRVLGEVNELEYLESFDVRGQVTGADASADGRRLAVLTYDRVWLFERSSPSGAFFTGRVWTRAYRMPDSAHGETSAGGADGVTGPGVGNGSDCESICFEEGERSLIIADEGRGMLYRVGLEEIVGTR